jgi:RimJ/RimL family protein N-acetyltransferase
MAKSIPTDPRFTPRLELRPFKRRDLDAVVEAIDASIGELEQWLPWANRSYGRAEANQFLRESGTAWADGRAFDFAIRQRSEPDIHIGNISVWPTSRRERAGEIGYWIRSSVTGQGIATEAAARIAAVGFSEMDLHRITLRIAVGNRASERVAEKLGFAREGLLRKEVLVRGRWMDHSLWAMLEEEFRRERPRWAEAGYLE